MIYKTLNNLSASIIQNLNDEGKLCFTTDTVEKILPNFPRNSIRRLLADMVRRGLISRIKESLYFLIPYEQDPDTYMPDWHLLVPYLIGEAEYYIGYYSAMQIHSLITQPALKEQIVVNKQIRPAVLEIKHIPFQFIYHNETHFYGFKKQWVDGFNKVNCSDLEKTFVDILFKPDYGGGISEIAKALHKSKSNLNYKKLADYAVRFDSLAVCKRLGYLLELLDIDVPEIKLLLELPTKSFFLLEPSRPKEGKLLSRWNLQLNTDKESILSPLYT
jgi:predicted transcriptional regulator of viral defense system